MTYKIADLNETQAEDQTEQEIEVEAVKAPTPVQEEQEETQNSIDIKILNQDLTKSDDYFFNFDFNLKINNLKKLKRKLLKCDLCSHTIVIESSNDDSLLKAHILNEHVIIQSDTDPLEQVLTNLIDSMIKTIEDPINLNYQSDQKHTFKCSFDSQTFRTKQDLTRHLNKHFADSLNKLRCFYCSKHFDHQKNLKDYTLHLSTAHQDDIMANQLVSNNIEGQNSYEMNWDDYFKDYEDLTELPKLNKPSKTWTCQMCKKQFDQRVDLSKHQCIELNLRLLKKKKELRKKKWKEAHWKRKIDLSYIETTSLTQLSHNIADNLSFCIDGTQEDMRAYSREVRDYLSTELGHETQIQMFLKCCFPDIYQDLISQISNLTEANAAQLVDLNVLKKANSYFIDSDPKFEYNCKNCRGGLNTKFSKIHQLIQHQRDMHGFDLKTAFENFKSTHLNNSPIGYLACDPFAYFLNLHWDKEIKLKCSNCGAETQRSEYKKHLLDCEAKVQEDGEYLGLNQDEEEIIIFSARTDNYPKKPVIIKCEEVDSEIINSIVKEILDDLLNKIETEEKTKSIAENSNYSKRRRRKRTAQELLEEHLGSNNILNKKRTVQTVKNDEYLYFDQQQEQLDLQPVQKHVQTRKSTRSSSSVCSNESQASPLKTPVKVKVQAQVRTSPRNRQKAEVVLSQEKSRPSLRSSRSSTNSSMSNSPIKTEMEKQSPRSESRTSLITVRVVNNRKVHTCDKCGLEFTSGNSVLRHQEKSCLRVKVITLNVDVSQAKGQVQKKKCPICSSVFYNTHRLSIHIYRHHRNLLGSAHEPVMAEAKRLNEIQLVKLSRNELDEVIEDEMDAGDVDYVAEGLDASVDVEDNDIYVSSDMEKEKEKEKGNHNKQKLSLLLLNEKLNSTI